MHAVTYADAETAAAPAPARAVGPWTLAWRRLRRDRVALASGIVVALVLFAVIAGGPIAEKVLGHGPNDQFPYAVDELMPVGPWTHVPDTFLLGTGPATDGGLGLPAPDAGTGTTLFLLGSDGSLGRDEFLRLLYGGRVSLEVAIGATLLAILIGTVLGAAAGYVGGLVDAAISRFTDLVMAFPYLLFLVMIGSAVSTPLVDTTLGGILNKGVLQLVLLIGAFTWFYPARIVRSRVMSLRGSEFVEAAAMTGARDTRIVRTHLLPHVVPPLVVYATLAIATNVMIEIGVTFLGAGVRLPTASWGSMLSQTWGSLLDPSPSNPATTMPLLTLIPSLAIFVTVFAFNQFGEGLREALDPRSSR
ncbi:MAG TPA: ABC transporter permease [Gaiellaceae bacterium]|nr:ABC transporter permease [Gaiellaceae bacterium]